MNHVADIFLSYAHENIEQARDIAEALSAEGWTVFWDRRIPPGRKFEEYIEQRVKECRVMVVLWSPHSVASEWVRIEASAGRRRRVLIPALISGTEIPFGYDHLHAADLTDWRRGMRSLEFEEFVSSIESLAPRLWTDPLVSNEREAVGGSVAFGGMGAIRVGAERTEANGPDENRARPLRPALATDADGPGNALLDAILADDDQGVSRHRSHRALQLVPWSRSVAPRLAQSSTAVVIGVLVLGGSFGTYVYQTTRSPAGNLSNMTSGPPPASLGAGPESPLVPSTKGASSGEPADGAPAPATAPISITAPENPLSPPRPVVPVVASDARRATGSVKFRPDAWFLPDEPLFGFVSIAAGPFLMGSNKSNDAAASEDERWGQEGGQGRLELPAFYIGRYEVTVAQFRAYLTATSGKPVSPRSTERPSDEPVRNVSWHEAMEYCRWLEREMKQSPKAPQALKGRLQQDWHVGLPSEAEWEKAARGTDGRIYPWGGGLDDKRADYPHVGVLSVGSRRSSVSPFGIMDMSANVSEWTRSLYRGYPYVPTDGREDVTASGTRVVRGGLFGELPTVARTAARSHYDPESQANYRGFRLVVSRF